VERWVLHRVLACVTPETRHHQTEAGGRRGAKNNLAASGLIVGVVEQDSVVTPVLRVNMMLLRRMVRMRMQRDRARCADQDERQGEACEATEG
jgi:hypothetical protein